MHSVASEENPMARRGVSLADEIFEVRIDIKDELER